MYKPPYYDFLLSKSFQVSPNKKGLERVSTIRSIEELFAPHLPCQTRRKRENSHPNHLENGKLFPKQHMSPREGEFDFSEVDSDDCGSSF